jgi:hypothetical protein
LYSIKKHSLFGGLNDLETKDLHIKDLRFLKGYNIRAFLKDKQKDESKNLQDYFIKSSHNTYLIGHQFYG